ncbi:MAG TPA: response regulator [Terriglobia bacterium]|nr:response regulator [Terriglobia bacterium]
MGGPSGKILVVDDDEALVGMLGTFLSQHGYETDVAYSGSMALKRVEAFHPDLVLMDIGLPDVSGLEILRRIRSVPSYQEITIILITGTSGLEMKIEGFHTGANDYISKPIVPRELLLKVERFLKTAENHQKTIESIRRETLNTLVHTVAQDLAAPLAAIRNEIALADLDQDLDSLRTRLKTIEGMTRQIQETIVKLSAASRVSSTEPLPGYQLLEQKDATSE